MDCIFCGIVAGQAEASVVATSERAVAFLDLFPFAEGHTLVIPRAHSVGLSDLDDEDAAEVMRLGRRVATAQLQLGLGEGVNLFLADGEVAGQEVFHAHLHVLPRHAGDGLPVSFGAGEQPSRDHLDAVAARLGDAVG